MTKNKTYYKKLAIKVIDFVLETTDVIEIGVMLIQYGLSYDDLLELGYGKKVVEEIQEEIDKELIK